MPGSHSDIKENISSVKEICMLPVNTGYEIHHIFLKEFLIIFSTQREIPFFAHSVLLWLVFLQILREEGQKLKHRKK